jgi:Protein of unknown function (DUF2911)
VFCAIAVTELFLTCAAIALPANGNPQLVQASCILDDGKQISVRYNPAPESGKSLPPAVGKVWAPGGSPMFLFTSATLLVGNSEIPVGAYSVYAIPEKRDWTLIINRDVKFRRGLYKESQDIARAPMQVGELPQSQQQTSIYFGHSPPKQCNMRIYAHMLRRRGHVGGVSREVTANGSHPSAPGHGRISKRPPTLY